MSVVGCGGRHRHDLQLYARLYIDMRQAYLHGDVQAAQRLMRRHRVQGVPALVVHSAAGDRLLQGNVLYDSVELDSFLRTV